MYRGTSDDESVAAIQSALAAGINYIDTAPWYGHGKAETLLGKVCKTSTALYTCAISECALDNLEDRWLSTNFVQLVNDISLFFFSYRL